MSWRITSTTSSILRQTKENEYLIPENTPAMGGTIQQRYYFEGINYGTAYIEFSYGRPWEETPPERTFGATITVAEPVHDIYIARDSDNDRHIALKLDQMLILKLKNGSSSDETWYLREELPEQLKLLSDPFIEYFEEVRYSVFYFRTVERGEGVLELSYGSSASPDQSIDTYRITLKIE
jgi:predicted secreted protein